MNGLPTILLYASISEQVFTEAPFAFFVRDILTSSDAKVVRSQRDVAGYSRGNEKGMIAKKVLGEESTRTGQNADCPASGAVKDSNASNQLTVTALVEINSGENCWI